MAFETPPMETLLSSFFNIRATDSFVCLFIKIYGTEQNLGRREERGAGDQGDARGVGEQRQNKKREEGWTGRMTEGRSQSKKE